MTQIFLDTLKFKNHDCRTIIEYIRAEMWKDILMALLNVRRRRIAVEEVIRFISIGCSVETMGSLETYFIVILPKIKELDRISTWVDLLSQIVNFTPLQNSDTNICMFLSTSSPVFSSRMWCLKIQYLKATRTLLPSWYHLVDIIWCKVEHLKYYSF